eukprot:scaffold1370_cov271-Pinguiococcus_pyrenoidosus.AAC.3
MTEFEVPWVEKYRPQLLSDVVGNADTVARLAAIAEMGNLPNVILCGPPGTGKTTSVHALARQMLGDAYKEAVLELNASDARGIDTVRGRIKMFAQKRVTLPRGKHKIVILDEADSMTAAAQQAMRRTMEIYSNTTRFALACNISTKIIEPIQSRCAILRYTRLSDDQILERLRQVCEAEDVGYTQEGLDAIVFTAEGDMRHALNGLQSTVSGFEYVSQENVFKVCDQPHPVTVRRIIGSCEKKDLFQALDLLKGLYDTGYSAQVRDATMPEGFAAFGRRRSLMPLLPCALLLVNFRTSLAPSSRSAATTRRCLRTESCRSCERLASRT